jgi:hypothetical protein
LIWLGIWLLRPACKALNANVAEGFSLAKSVVEERKKAAGRPPAEGFSLPEKAVGKAAPA